MSLQWLIAATLLTLATNAPASLSNHPTSQAAIPQETIGEAALLIDKIHPNEETLRTNMRGWEIGIRAAMAKNPAIAKLEAAYPGLIDSGVEAGRPIAIKYLSKMVRDMKARKSELLAQHMTVSQLHDARLFFSSSVGQNYLRRIAANVDLDQFAHSVVDRAADTGSLEITEQDAAKALKGAVQDAATQMTADETLAILKFEQTPAAKKMAEIRPKIAQVELEMANNPDPEWMTKQNETVTKALISFAESKAAGPAK